MNQSMSDTRREILLLLKRRGRATVEELSVWTGLTGVGVRHHLAALKAEGIVTSIHERRARGRPVEIFQLTEQADERLFPRRYDVLLEQFLDRVGLEDGQRKLQRIFEERNRQIYESCAPSMVGKSLKERVAQLAKMLEEHGFMTDWEDQGDYLVLTAHNCCVPKIAERFNVTCSCEQQLIRDLLEADVVRDDFRLAGSHCCSYVIRPIKRK